MQSIGTEMAMQWYRYLGLLVLGVSCLSAVDSDENGSTLKSLDSLLPAIDEYIENYMSYKDVPGLGLSIVSGDVDKLAKGYGVKRLGTDDNVTDKTLFYIASTTKAMTASVLLETMMQNK